MMRAYHLVLSFGLLTCFIKPSILFPTFEEATKLLKSVDQDYGYVEVRPGAHLFWWLQHAGGKVAGSTDKPLLLWIQGGPSLPASGIGNFFEFGPLDVGLQKRNYSWVNKRNVLFVDSPVGTGFSYSEKEDLLCKTDKEIAADLAELVKQFLKNHPKFKSTPFHIFSQSYGAKVAAHLAARLHREKQEQRIDINLQTVGLGSAFVSPRESTKAIPGLLYHMGYVDRAQYETMQEEVDEIMKFLDNKLYKQAFDKRTEFIHRYIRDGNIDVNNILKKFDGEGWIRLQHLMNNFVKPVLGSPIPKHVQWEFFNETVWNALSAQFMKPANHIVEDLLEQTDFNIVIYNGNMDVATPLTGAENWANKLNWYGAEEFKRAKRVPLNGFMNGYIKRHSRLHFWSILNAGHWIPSDNPVVMDRLLDYFAAIPEMETTTFQTSTTADTTDDESLQDDVELVSTTTEPIEQDVEQNGDN